VSTGDEDTKPRYRYRRILRDRSAITFDYKLRGMWRWRTVELTVPGDTRNEGCEEIIHRWLWLLSREGEG